MIFNWVSKHNLTIQEAKALLTRTAIPLLSSLDPYKRNGAGLLSVYKILRVAKRLKEKCRGTDPVDFENQELIQRIKRCFNENLFNDETYLFTPKSNPELFPETSTLPSEFFSSSTSEDDKENMMQEVVKKFDNMSDESKKEELLSDLRKAAFLDPHQASLWRAIGSLYERKGFSVNAFHYRSIGLAVEIQKKELNPVPGFETKEAFKTQLKDFLDEIVSSLEGSGELTNDEDKNNTLHYLPILKTLSLAFDSSIFEALKIYLETQVPTLYREVKLQLTKLATAMNQRYTLSYVTITQEDKRLLTLYADIFLKFGDHTNYSRLPYQYRVNYSRPPGQYEVMTHMKKIIHHEQLTVDLLKELIQLMEKLPEIDKYEAYKMRFLFFQEILKLQDKVDKNIFANIIQHMARYIDLLDLSPYRHNNHDFRTINELKSLFNDILAHSMFSQIENAELSNIARIAHVIFEIKKPLEPFYDNERNTITEKWNKSLINTVEKIFVPGKLSDINPSGLQSIALSIGTWAQEGQWIGARRQWIELSDQDSEWFMQQVKQISDSDSLNSIGKKGLHSLILAIINQSKRQSKRAIFSDDWMQSFMDGVGALIEKSHSLDIDMHSLSVLVLAIGYQSPKGRLPHPWFKEKMDTILNHEKFKEFDTVSLKNTALALIHQSRQNRFLENNTQWLIDRMGEISRHTNFDPNVFQQISWISNQIQSLDPQVRLGEKICEHQEV